MTWRRCFHQIVGRLGRDFLDRFQDLWSWLPAIPRGGDSNRINPTRNVSFERLDRRVMLHGESWQDSTVHGTQLDGAEPVPDSESAHIAAAITAASADTIPADRLPAEDGDSAYGRDTYGGNDTFGASIFDDPAGGKEDGNTDTGDYGTDNYGADFGGSEKGSGVDTGGTDISSVADTGGTEKGSGADTTGTDSANSTATDGTDTVGTDTVGTDTVGTDTVGTDTVGTDTVGTDTVGTDTVGTDTDGTEKGSGADGSETAGNDSTGHTDGGLNGDTATGDGGHGDRGDGDLGGSSLGDGSLGDGSAEGTSGDDGCTPMNEDPDCVDTGTGNEAGDTGNSDAGSGDTSGIDADGTANGSSADGSSSGGAGDTGQEDSGAGDSGASEGGGSNTAGVDTAGSGSESDGTELSGTDTSGSDISGSDTSGSAATSGADTAGSNADGTETSGSDTSGSDTSGSDTSGSDTSGSDSSGSSNGGADLGGTETSDTSGAETAGSDMSGESTSGNEGNGVGATGSTGDGGNDTGGITSGSDMQGTDTSGTGMSGTDTSGEDTFGTDTSGTDTSGTDTAGNETSGVETSGGDNSGADMSGTASGGSGSAGSGGDPCGGDGDNNPPLAHHDPTQDDDPATPVPDIEFEIGHKQMLDVSAPGVLENDTDADSCDTSTAVLVTAAAHGTVTLHANGSFRYDPSDTFAGHDKFTYQASDGKVLSNIATVFLLVTNEPPVANDDSYLAVYATELTVNAANGVLANDTDPDDDPLTALHVAGPGHGTLSLNSDGSFTYRPDAKFSGEDTFTYRARDGIDSSEIATVTINVVKPTVDVDTDSDNTGAVERSDVEDATEMNAPGNILRANFDDDNNNCEPDVRDAPFKDSHGNAMFDDELEQVVIAIDNPGLDLDGFTLRLVNVGPIDIWATGDKQPLTSKTLKIGTDEIPDTIFVEGYRTGAAQLQLYLYNSQNVLIAQDSVKFTVMDADLIAYRPVTEGPGYGLPFQRWPVPEDQEDHVGIRRNGDDDDVDGVVDGLQPDSVSWENDTIEFDAVSYYPNAPGVDFAVRRSNRNISVFNDRGRAIPILAHDVDSAVLPGPSGWVDWFDRHAEPSATLELVVRDSVTGNVAFIADTLTFVPFHSVVIVFNGEFQDFQDPPIDPATHGIIQFAIQEYRNSGYDIHGYEESAYTGRDIRTGPAWREILNAVNNRGVTQVAIIGYSHGGADVYYLADALANPAPHALNNFIVPMTGYIDAIWQPFTNTAPVTRRPPLSQFHVNQYQTNGILDGAPSDGDDDIDRTYLNVDHETIDDHAVVLDLLRQRLYQKVER